MEYKPLGKLSVEEQEKLKFQYHKDTVIYPEPWLLWEHSKEADEGEWFPCVVEPQWAARTKYRRKNIEKKLTGGSSDYYKVNITNPTSPELEPYTAECNDIIEALNLSFAEGNILKAIWRIAKNRTGEGKPGVSNLYDAEKIKFFADRVLIQEQRNELKNKAN